MKRLFILILLLWSGSVVSQQIAVVELFTSQGCSSCPTADQLLKEVVANKSEKGEVIGLSFHVGYWNRLGWKDPYSSEEYTERQKWYAQQKNLRSMYTPQVIVDGGSEFVGSNRVKMKAAILSSFTQKKSPILIDNLRKKNGVVSFDFQCKASAYDVIHFAIVQKEASNYVPRGENHHKTLKHANVVRVFRTIPFQNKNKMSLNLPKSNPEKAEQLILVAYAQNQKTLTIGAVGVSTL